MGLFKAVDEELDVEESNIESQLKESTLEDLDEFVDSDSRKRSLLQVMSGNCMPVFMHSARDRLTLDSQTARARKGHENVLDSRLLLGNGGLTSVLP